MELKTLFRYKKPTTKEELKIIIEKHFKRKCYNLNDIDTSLITNMSYLFKGVKTNFRFNVSKWNTGNVENMQDMFWGCKFFNSDISGWDVRKVKDMSGMFYCCPEFNQDISSWNIEGVNNICRMFYGCTSFNQDLSKWNVRNLIWKYYTFEDCQIKEEWKPKYLELYGKTI